MVSAENPVRIAPVVMSNAARLARANVWDPSGDWTEVNAPPAYTVLPTTSTAFTMPLVLQPATGVGLNTIGAGAADGIPATPTNVNAATSATPSFPSLLTAQPSRPVRARAPADATKWLRGDYMGLGVGI